MMYRLLPALIVLGAIGLFFGFIQPVYTGDIATLRAEIAGYDTALAAAKQFKQKEVELTQQQASIPPEQLARLDAFLPDSVDNVQLILDLNSLAARSGVQLSEFDISGAGVSEQPAAGAPVAQPTANPSATTDPFAPFPLTAGEPIESLELSVSATGTYGAFRTFLEGVEKSLRPLDVVELSLQDAKSGVYTYDVTIRLYWLR